MTHLTRSPECPLGPQIDEVTAIFLENMVHLKKGTPTGWSEDDIERANADGNATFAELYGGEKLIAVQGCAQAIAAGKCSLWRYDPDANGLVPVK